MSYPTTGHEVYVSLNLSNTMLTGIGKGTITREEVSVDYLKDLFSRHGVIVSAKPEQARLLNLVNEQYDLKLDIPEKLKLFQLSEQHRRLAALLYRGGICRGHLLLRQVLCPERALRRTEGAGKEAGVRAGAGACLAQPHRRGAGVRIWHEIEGGRRSRPLYCVS